MAAEIVHPVPVEEVRGWSRTMAATFLGDPTSASATLRSELLAREWEPERAWGARDRGRWVATLRTETRRMRVPGRAGGPGTEIVVDALTNVTVAATHRRRGLMSRMLEGSLRAARERGDAVSVLIAAEWPIYGRFGYAPATFGATHVLRSTRRGATLAGELDRIVGVEPDAFGELAAQVHAATRGWRWAGQLDRDAAWWDRALGREGLPPIASPLPTHWLVHEGDAGPDGLLAWRPAEDGGGLIPPYATAEVWLLAAANPVAYRDLWAYLAGLDLVDEVRLPGRPVDEPVRWLLADGRTLVTTETVDFVWARLLDVPAALAARRYSVDGELVLDVRDNAAGGLAGGRYVLRVRDEAVECAPTHADADLVVDQRALASAFLGSVRLRDRAFAGEVAEARPGALVHADLMFATAVPPWNPTWF